MSRRADPHHLVRGIDGIVWLGSGQLPELIDSCEFPDLPGCIIEGENLSVALDDSPCNLNSTHNGVYLQFEIPWGLPSPALQ